ncbi:MAG: chemotaxis protein MotB [Desulfuromonas sp.]|nr:MAG: chemotaxis protein MotB [Desulfuromonas sp.]
MRHIYLLFVTLSICAGCVSQQQFDEQLAKTSAAETTMREQAAIANDLARDKVELEQIRQRLRSDLEACQGDLANANADIDLQYGNLQRLEKALSEQQQAARANAELSARQITQLRSGQSELEKQIERERIAREARLAKIKKTYDQLVGKLEEEIDRGEVTISNLQGRLTVNLVERILFDSGKAEVKPGGLKVLLRVGDILKQSEGKVIQVEGHTDNVPISSRLVDKFPTNWELSTARAANVVHVLQKKVGIPGERLAVAGYGEYRPVAANTTAKGREQNRRIQIVLVPRDGRFVQSDE